MSHPASAASNRANFLLIKHAACKRHHLRIKIGMNRLNEDGRNHMSF